MTAYVEICNPKTVGIYPVDANLDTILNTFIRRCAKEGNPAFITMYKFTDNNYGWDTESIVLDRIRVDIDADGHVGIDNITLSRARDAVTKLKKVGLRPRIYFSGNSGFAMEIRFDEVNLVNKDATVKQVLRNMNESLGDILDKQAMLGARQKFRIVNSVHQKSGLYCIPLTEHQLFNLRPVDITRLARSPVDYDTTPTLSELQANSKLVAILHKTSDQLNDTVFIHGQKGYLIPPAENGMGWPVRPCVKNLIATGDVSWTALTSLVQELANQNYTDDEIHRALEDTWNNAGRHDQYSHLICGKEINRIRVKGHRAPHCLTQQGKGLCDGKCADKQPWTKL